MPKGRPYDFALKVALTRLTFGDTTPLTTLPRPQTTRNVAKLYVKRTSTGIKLQSDEAYDSASYVQLSVYGPHSPARRPLSHKARVIYTGQLLHALDPDTIISADLPEGAYTFFAKQWNAEDALPAPRQQLGWNRFLDPYGPLEDDMREPDFTDLLRPVGNLKTADPVQAHNLTSNTAKTILDISPPGGGMVRHMFIALGNYNPNTSGCRLRCYYDGNLTPDWDVPISALACSLWRTETSDAYNFNSHLLGASKTTGGGFGMTLYLPLPFAESIKIEVFNDPAGNGTGTPDTDSHLLYSYIGYSEGVPLDRGRYGKCHLVHNAAHYGPGDGEHQIHPIIPSSLFDKGVLLGIIMNTRQPDGEPNIDEGNLMFTRESSGNDPDWQSSSFEDYFGSAFFYGGGISQGQFYGTAHAGTVGGALVRSSYRWHIPDPYISRNYLKLEWQVDLSAFGMDGGADVNSIAIYYTNV